MSQLYQNALYGTVMVLVVAILRRALKDRLVPGARLALWAACLFRLLTPAAPESVLSFWGLSRLFAGEEQPAPMPVITNYAPIAPAPAPQSPGPVISWETAALAVWAAIGVALAVRYALSWRRTRRAVSCAIPLGRDDPRYAPLPKCTRLREGPMEGAPLTFGAVRPTVVLSPGLGGVELDCVLAHEGVHAARRDNLWHYAMALALAIYWWNPAVWLMSRLLRRDVELSCDRAALNKLGAERRADYAQALVTLATQGSGPAFCQTFGRKAAEERIISIMKFKKISIIGVIFTLTLVLAVTAAFASEPKTDDTIVFHDQTFSRSELSQETLDWLDWYLALPEEEQLAVSYVPAELNRSRDAATQDAYNGPLEFKTLDGIVSVPDIEATKGIQSDLPVVDPDNVDLSMMKELLAKKVADGEITQEEADQRLAATEETLEQARRGEVKIVMTGDGTCYGLGVSRMYYRDEDGNLVPFSPDTAATGYVDEPQAISDYAVKFPAFDENGNPVSADGGVVGRIGSQFYDYKTVENDPGVSGGAVRTSDGLYDLCEDKICKVSYDHCHIDGAVVRVYYENPGLLCAHPDCTNEEPHEHDGVQYAGKYTILNPDMEPVPSAMPVSSGHHSESHHSDSHHSSEHH